MLKANHILKILIGVFALVPLVALAGLNGIEKDPLSIFLVILVLIGPIFAPIFFVLISFIETNMFRKLINSYYGFKSNFINIFMPIAGINIATIIHLGMKKLQLIWYEVRLIEK